jgi:hypothetical protein
LIRGNDRQEINIHWGNAGAEDASDGKAVFKGVMPCHPCFLGGFG